MSFEENTTEQTWPSLSKMGIGVIIILYLAHALPLYFYNVALPGILRYEGIDLRWIGMLSLLYIPWAFKFLWAPYIDQFYIRSLGKRKTWLLVTQSALFFGVIALALTQFAYGLWCFIFIGLWISTFAATQDIAIDGYTVEAIPSSEYRFGSMAQSIGVALGSMLGGAGTLWLYQDYGWQVALSCLAVFIAMSMLAIFRVSEKTSDNKNLIQHSKPSLRHALRRPEMRWALLLILCYRFVEAPAMAMLTPMLIDQKWSLSEIGLLMSVLGAGVGLLAAISAALLLKKIFATRLLIVAAVFRTLIYGFLAFAILIGWIYQTQLLLAGGVIALLAVRYVAMTSLYAYFMQSSSKTQAGTDFTLLVCFELFIYFIGGAMSGFLAKSLGYGYFYLLLTVISLLSLILSQLIIFQIKKLNSTEIHHV